MHPSASLHIPVKSSKHVPFSTLYGLLVLGSGVVPSHCVLVHFGAWYEYADRSDELHVIHVQCHATCRVSPSKLNTTDWVTGGLAGASYSASTSHTPSHTQLSNTQFGSLKVINGQHTLSGASMQSYMHTNSKLAGDG